MKEILVNIAPILPILLVILFFTKKQKPWSELTQNERKTRIILIITSVLLLVGGIIVAILY